MGSGTDAALVLIADDDEGIRLALALIVEENGHSPLLAHHGQQAVEIARARLPDLIITDLMMPQLSGTQVIATVRADAVAAGRRPPPCVLMTAASSAFGEESGADAFLPKPFDIDGVEKLLTRFLGS